jgi:CO dehydrogenase maturation factor
MKIAITGKGGVGKSTVAGMMAHIAAREGNRVLAIDADPDANLAFALGIPEKEWPNIVPISRQKELIEDRTGAKLKQFGQIFKLNPHVADIADRYSFSFRGINLLVLGAIKAGGSGCACPESIFLRTLLSSIILQRDECVIVDMEAGIEHLGRATAQDVDVLVIVSEPTLQSIGTARSIQQLAAQLGLTRIVFVGNKITAESDYVFLCDHLSDLDSLGFIPYAEGIRLADMYGKALIDHIDEELYNKFSAIYDKLTEF